MNTNSQYSSYDDEILERFRSRIPNFSQLENKSWFPQFLNDVDMFLGLNWIVQCGFGYKIDVLSIDTLFDLETKILINEPGDGDGDGDDNWHVIKNTSTTKKDAAKSTVSKKNKISKSSGKNNFYN